MKRWYWLIPPLLAIIVYAPAPWGELVWDDATVFTRQIVAFKTVGDVFFPPDGIFQWAENYYRPVVVLSYLLDIKLYGDAKTVGLHISNVAYHVVTTFFVWLLARRLFQHLPHGSLGAVLAATVFAVHPIHTESVSWVTGRSDVLAAMFLVPSVTLTLVWRDSGAKWALSLGAVLYLLALLSKEVAIAALILVPAALLLTPRRGNARTIANNIESQENLIAQLPPAYGFRTGIVMWLTTAFIFLGVTSIYLALRHTGNVTYGVPLEVSWLEFFGRLQKSTAYYLVKVLVPWPQTHRPAWELMPGFIVTNVAFLITVSLLGLSIWFWQRCRDGSLLLAMTWFGAALGPSIVVAVRFISDTPVAERYLYLPSVGLSLLLGFICCQPYLGKWLKPAPWALALLIIAYSVATVERGMIWISNVSLWTDAAEKMPRFGEAWNNLGIAYLKLGDYDQALFAFQRSLDGVNDATGRSYATRNIALTYQFLGDLQRAKEYYSVALDEKDDNPEAHLGLGMIYMAEAKNIKKDSGPQAQIDNNLDLAAGYFESTLRLNPFHSQARLGLSSVLTDRAGNYEIEGNPQQAIAHYRSALAETDSLIAQDPAFRSHVEVLKLRARLEAALKRLTG
jgi:tetratricopeptide (TPR) repeat protein